MANMFDERKIESSYHNAFDIFSEVVNVMKAETPGRFIKLAKAITAGDSHEVVVQAGSLKGTFSLFYAKTLVEIFSEIERHGQKDKLQESKKKLVKAQKDFDVFLTELDLFMHKIQRVA